jgi:ENTS family enterobactin (siderophore) exporter
MPHWALGALCLALFGWLSAISSLLQYTLIQTQTPEHMLGRINGLWTAQNVTGDAIGAALLGGLGAVMTPALPPAPAAGRWPSSACCWWGCYASCAVSSARKSSKKGDGVIARWRLRLTGPGGAGIVGRASAAARQSVQAGFPS